MSHRLRHWLPLISGFFIIVASCNKRNDGGSAGTLSYANGTNVIFLKNTASGDVVIQPDHQLPAGGEFEGWPDGIEIDDNTGAINISDSETGLKYRVKYTAPNGDTSVCMVLLSGITFTDKFYHLSQNDSVANPVYNANPANSVPLTGSNFDEGNVANSGGCSVQTFNGTINLAETVRNGIFGAVPQNNERRDFEIKYRLNDESGKALNKLKVRLYYYDTMADVPQDLWDELNDRQSQGVFLRSANAQQVAKPRPPCVIITGQ